MDVIADLFAKNIHRQIEEVIKVDQTDEEILKAEIDEYETTSAIRSHYTKILERYSETPNKPHEGIGVWISGFFGSGKSSFAKILGLVVSNRSVKGESAGELFAARTGDQKITVLLKTIAEKIPTHAVIFDVSTDRGIRSGNQTLTEIMYGLFLQSLGYAKDLDLSELEIGLEESGQLEKFEREYKRLYNKKWADEKGKIAFALPEASRVRHEMDPQTYPMADSWVKAVKDKADISPNKLAARASELMDRRRPGENLIFVVDEVGQFVSRDVQKMLDLQGIVQSLGVKGRGRHWLIVTSQEQLGELIGGLEDSRIELARLMDRFPGQVHLERTDISEVTSRRVLTKNAEAQGVLGKIFDDNRGRLAENTRLTADLKLPELSRDGFIDLYPLLPYQVDLIIEVVSGLRTEGGASKHVGGANRTIIKLAQQLLINPAVDLANKPIGELARLDQIYDLVEGNLDSDIRAKIATIPKELTHPMAQAVAKAICLLQYVQTVHRTEENIAASLHASVDGDSSLANVKEAIQELIAAQKVRAGEDGYRIPLPAEDDWERTRNGINPKPGDAHRIYSETLTSFWQPQPSHSLHETRVFKSALTVDGRELVAGDLTFHVRLSEGGSDHEETSASFKARSQMEKSDVFWAVELNEGIDGRLVEVFRSKEIIARKEREARTKDESALVAEEKVRLRKNQDELRRLLKVACLKGNVYFRGNDRSPREGAADVGKAAGEIMAEVLPNVFDRYREGAAKPADVKKGVEALFVAENLQGLPPVFASLGLLRDEKSKTVFNHETGPLSEVLRRIEDRAEYGDAASGRSLADEFGREPFGWDFETVRLFVLSLLRAGVIDATSKSQTIESATSVAARETFANNNLFRQASFRPKKGLEFEELVKAAEAFKETFGREVSELGTGAIVSELNQEVDHHEDAVTAAHSLLVTNALPGESILQVALGEMKAILRGSEENAVATFNASYRSIKDAIKRSAEVNQELSDMALKTVNEARRTLGEKWAFLQEESDLDETLRKDAQDLKDVLARETFFRDVPLISQLASRIEEEYARRHKGALHARVDAYQAARELLESTPGWLELDKSVREGLGGLLRSDSVGEGTPIPQLRADLDAVETRLQAAVREVYSIVEGERLVTLNLNEFFKGGIETEEQLDSALGGIREELTRLIGAGKKVIVQ